jgi:predicted dithiol-disulfide oxidoreductase (DUF899 family)
MNLPPIVSRDEWLAARKELLAKERELTLQRDILNADRRRLPMVRIDKAYAFEGPQGKVQLSDLFAGRQQLIVYHFMFDPHPAPAGKSGSPWDEGCEGCSHIGDSIPHLAHLRARETSLVFVSRATLAKIEPFKARMGWNVPWYSSFGSDFNRDFHVTLDETSGSVEWNYRSASDLLRAGKIGYVNGELPGLSVFLRDGSDIFHTYSTYARGLDPLIGTYQFLDLTPFGRGEGWGGMPDIDGKGQGWLRHHDRYDDAERRTESCCAPEHRRA